MTLAVIVSTNASTAQVMFLIAVVVAGLAGVGALVARGWPYLSSLLAVAVFFIALGLLFAT